MSHAVEASDRDVLDWLLGPIDWTRSCHSLLYLLLAFPLGLSYFIFFSVGLSIGAGLSVILIGVPILLGVLRVSRSLGSLERHLARSLLYVDIPPPAAGLPSAGLLADIKALLCDPITWKSLAFLVIKFPLGIVSFVLIVTSFSVSVSLTLTPLIGYFAPPVDVSFWVPWQTPTVPGEAACCLAGVVLFIASMHLLDGFALAWGRLARFGLGQDTSPSTSR